MRCNHVKKKKPAEAEDDAKISPSEQRITSIYSRQFIRSACVGEHNWLDRANRAVLLKLLSIMRPRQSRSSVKWVRRAPCPAPAAGSSRRRQESGAAPQASTIEELARWDALAERTSVQLGQPSDVRAGVAGGAGEPAPAPSQEESRSSLGPQLSSRAGEFAAAACRPAHGVNRARMLAAAARIFSAGDARAADCASSAVDACRGGDRAAAVAAGAAAAGATAAAAWASAASFSDICDQAAGGAKAVGRRRLARAQAWAPALGRPKSNSSPGAWDTTHRRELV